MTQENDAYFDGVVSGAPAMRTGYSAIGSRAIAVALNQAAPKDASGKPNPSALFSDTDKKLVVNAILILRLRRMSIKKSLPQQPIRRQG